MVLSSVLKVKLNYQFAMLLGVRGWEVRVMDARSKSLVFSPCVVSDVYEFYFWFKYDLGQKYYAPQVRPEWGSNSWPPDHDSTFHATATPALTTDGTTNNCAGLNLLENVEFRGGGEAVQEWVSMPWLFVRPMMTVAMTRAGTVYQNTGNINVCLLKNGYRFLPLLPKVIGNLLWACIQYNKNHLLCRIVMFLFLSASWSSHSHCTAQ